MPGLPRHTNHTDHTVIRSYESSWAGAMFGWMGRRRRRKNVKMLQVFVALSLNAKKRRRGTAAFFFVEFF